MFLPFLSSFPYLFHSLRKRTIVFLYYLQSHLYPLNYIETHCLILSFDINYIFQSRSSMNITPIDKILCQIPYSLSYTYQRIIYMIPHIVYPGRMSFISSRRPKVCLKQEQDPSDPSDLSLSFLLYPEPIWHQIYLHCQIYSITRNIYEHHYLIC